MRLFCYLLVVLVYPLTLPALQVSTIDAALQRAFPAATRFEAQGVTQTTEERRRSDDSAQGISLDAYAVRYGAFAGEQSLGSAWMDDEIGKHRPITYLVALDRQGKILAVEMLTYREAHGLDAKSPRFTRQMKGKGPGDRLTVGKDLDAISGATLSCKTLAFGARKALVQEEAFKKAHAGPAFRPARVKRKPKE